jgi:beta-glucosidase
MMADAYRKGLPVALERGLVTMAQIDASVLRVLRLKERLGLFDDPYRRGSRPESPAVLTHRRELSRSVGARSIVMLKNDRETLPLRGTLRRLCLIGPLADAAVEMAGCWGAAGQPEDRVSVLAGLRAALPKTEIVHAAGVQFNSGDESGIAAAVDLCNNSDAVVLCIGEMANMSGEAASRAFPEVPAQQRMLAEAVFERARAKGLRVVVVLFSGRPLVIPSLAEKADALLAAWFPGNEAGNAIADVVLGRTSPSGRTPMSWPRAIGQVPLFYGERPSGRPFNPKDHFTTRYIDVPNDPLYPFGFGLTYGRFTLANLVVTPDRVSEKSTIEARVDVTNEGTQVAEETVFLFTHDKVATVTRPLLELKGVGKATVRPGETKTVRISLPATELRFLGRDLEPVFEPGEVEVLVGPCADRSQLLMQTIRLQGA